MGYSLIAWNNYAKQATITAGSSATNFPPLNIATDNGSPSVAWQSVYGVLTVAAGATITIKPLVVPKSWDVIGIFRTNLTAGATVTAGLWSNALGATVWTGSASGPSAGNGQVIILPPAGTIADYLVLGFNDPANPDGFINCPMAHCGSAWFPLGSVGYSTTIGRDVNVNEATSRGGQEYPSLYYQRRRINLNLDAMRVSETWTYCDPLNAYASAGSNVLCVPDTSSAYLSQEAVYGRLKPTADISYPYGASDRRRWQASITERL